MNETPKLYSVYTEVENWQGSGKQVTYSWFYHNRVGGPPAPYADTIVDWQPSADGKRDYNPLKDAVAFGYEEDCIDEMFTFAEAAQLRAWLSLHRPGNHQLYEQEDLPITSRMGLGALPVGGTDAFHTLCEDADYDLSFEVWGYYRFEHIYTEHLEVTTPNAGGGKPTFDHVRVWSDGSTGRAAADDLPFSVDDILF